MEKSPRQLFDMYNPIQLILFIALIVGAYMLGSLKTKVDMLQTGTGAVQGAVANAPVAPEAPPFDAKLMPEISDEDWVKGDENAEIALVEYSDTECPFCKRFHPTAQQIVDEYAGKVKWIYRHYPLSFHANAQKQAEAMECAGEQGGNDAFWKYTDAIYERTTSNGTGFALDDLVPLAEELGLNGETFKTCLDSDKFAQKVKDQMDGGSGAGITGTPGNIVINVKTGEAKLLAGAVPFEEAKVVIDSLLE